MEGVVSLQRACFPHPFPEELLWASEHLLRHMSLFPDGQFVAMDSDRVVASASATRISESKWQGHQNWDETVGGAFLETFCQDGNTLYGLDISVHPEYRGKGLGRSLYNLRFEAVRKLGLVRFGTACRLPDYLTYAETIQNVSVEEYASLVASQKVIDRTATPLLRYGLTYVGVIHDYMEDSESGNAAALMEWQP